jgi:hypothetical protein
VDVPDLDALALEAAGVYVRLRGRADLTALLSAGVCHYEVPFSFVPPDRPDDVVRGVVDCLVESPDGSVTVLEFKTGRPRPEHEAQAAVYADAVAAALGFGRVTVKILYP